MSHTDDMSRLAQEMIAAYDSRAAAVSTMQASTKQQLADLHAQHGAMATAQRQELAQFAQLLRRDMASLQHDLKTARAARSADQRHQLEAYTYNLRQDINRFCEARAATRKAEREQQRQQLNAYTQALRTSTHNCLAEAHSARMAIHNDHAGAHQAWQQFNNEMRQRRAR